MKLIAIVLLIPVVLSADIFTQNQKLSRTLNLGNYLEAPNEGEWTGGLKLSEDDFVRIAAKGFSSVRIPIRWSNHIDQNNTIDPLFMNRIEWVVQQANKNGLIALIDDHHFEGLMSDPVKNEPISIAIWEQISTHFAHVSNDSLFFEPVNEPHTEMDSDRWNSFLPSLVSTIRKTNPSRPIVIGTTGWGGISGLRDLKLPNDPNLIATVHYYLPFAFTHQGAEWVTGADAWLGTKWQGDFIEKRALKADIEEIASWSKSNNVPIFVGEFGSYSKGDLDSRLRWTHYCARLFESFTLPWAYWEYNQGFGLYDPVAKSWRSGLVDTLLSTDTKILSEDQSTVTFGAELISNGTFTTKTGWTHNVYNGAGATCQFTENGAVHTVSKAGAEFYNVQLLQSGISLKKGERYLLTATVSSTDAVPVSLGVMRKDYSSVAASGSIVAGASDKTIDVVIAPTSDESELTVSINLGYAVGTINLKSISLKQFSTTAINETRPVKVPSPVAVNGRTISIEKGANESAKISLFSAQGKLIYTTQLSESQQQWNIPADLANGWYGLIVTTPRGILYRGSAVLTEK